MTHEEAVDHLSGLIQVCKDGELGYKTAAGHVRNSKLGSVFEEYARERAGFARELEEEIKRLGGAAPSHGSLTGALHRGWMDLKSALTGGEPGGIVAACETGEDAAQAAFERVVNTDISGQSRSLVEKQWHRIEEAHKRLLRLKDEAEAGLEYPNNE